MSSHIQIARAKPNPVGKDKTSSGTPKPGQLVAEWVDMKNIGNEPVRFATMELHHTLFSDRCVSLNKTESYWSGGGDAEIQPGETLRVHTGRKEHENTLSAEDRGDGKWRAFAGLDRFVLNNRCGDIIHVLWTARDGTRYRDSAGYDPNPPEGSVLHRRGDKLQPVPGGVY
jgi:hypothetical protein